MPTQLMHIYGNRSFNRTIFRPHLYIYDNMLVYKKRHLFSHDEITLTYNHVSQVDIKKFILFFAHIEIITTATQNIKIRWVSRGQAIRAKKLIDDKVYKAHRRNHAGEQVVEAVVTGFEHSLSRLKELVSTGKITDKEYNQRKKQLLKKHY